MSGERKLRPCVLPSCRGERFDLVHKFPMDNERAHIWLHHINVPELNGLPLDQLRKRYFICSKHFRKNDYKNCESRSLNQTAYPRLFLNEENAVDATVYVDASPQNMDVSSTSMDDKFLLLPKHGNRSIFVLNSPVDSPLEINDARLETKPEFSTVPQVTMAISISPTTSPTTKTVRQPIDAKRTQTVLLNEPSQPKKTKHDVLDIRNQHLKENQKCKSEQFRMEDSILVDFYQHCRSSNYFIAPNSYFYRDKMKCHQSIDNVLYLDVIVLRPLYVCVNLYKLHTND